MYSPHLPTVAPHFTEVRNSLDIFPPFFPFPLEYQFQSALQEYLV